MAPFTVSSDNGEEYSASISNTGHGIIMSCPEIDLTVAFNNDSLLFVCYQNTKGTTQNKFEFQNNTEAIGAFIKIWRFVQTRSAYDISDIFQKRTKSARNIKPHINY
jgi:hypothetical protein